MLPNLIISQKFNVVFNSKITNATANNDANDEDKEKDDDHTNMKLPPLINHRKQIMNSRSLELINHINLNKKLLLLEIIVIKIQTCIRRYLSKLKVKKMKYYMMLFDSITCYIVERYIDEIVIEYSLDIVIKYIKNYNIQKNMKNIVYNEMLLFINELMEVTIDKMMVDIVKEIIYHATDIIIMNRSVTLSGATIIVYI